MVTRAMLFEEVWNYRFVPNSNLVDVHMGSTCIWVGCGARWMRRKRRP
jgi:hypothetical protein